MSSEVCFGFDFNFLSLIFCFVRKENKNSGFKLAMELRHKSIYGYGYEKNMQHTYNWIKFETDWSEKRKKSRQNYWAIVLIRLINENVRNVSWTILMLWKWGKNVWKLLWT